MLDVVKTAGYFCKRYESVFNKKIDEMKLHKLLYLAQRESMILFDKPLTDASFEAWKFGPVEVKIRKLFHEGSLLLSLSDDELKPYLPAIDHVFAEYASKSSWSLSSLTHGEYSWSQARRIGENLGKAAVPISNEDIRIDAHRIKIRRIILK